MSTPEPEASAQSIVETIREPLLILDTEHRVLLVNPAFERAFGITRAEALGRPLHELGGGQWDIPELRKLLCDVLPGASQITDFEVEHTFPGIGRRRLALNARSLEHQGTRAAAVLLAIEDVTARHERNFFEEQLRQAQKVDALGKLAGGVAHDFNNLLTVISGYVQLSLGQLGPDNPVHANLQEVEKAADRAAALTRQLLAFGRRQMIQPVVTDLGAHVRDIRTMLSRLIGEQIVLETVLPPHLGRVRVDPGQLDQVIMNLVLNARDAMPGGGRITIETQNAELDAEYARLRAGVKAGSYVMLAVTDTGMGMTGEVLAHLFEPFYTTKEVGKGTGLGLATVYGIVKQHGGNIWVYSEPGRGTTLKVYFPRVDAKTEIIRVETPASSPSSGSETILLAEDDAFVRLFVSRVLASAGYQVVEAKNGREALVAATDKTRPVDLLLSDLVMPEMGGAELAVRLAEVAPGIRTLYLSGYTQSSVKDLPGLGRTSAFLEKPFTPDVLLRKVRALLDGSG